MARIMTLPKIGVNMTEVVVDSWYVKPGDQIKEGDAILLAETDKATQEIFASDSGIVGKLLVQQGDKVQVHDPIMMLLDEGETVSTETVMVRQEAQAPADTEKSAGKVVIAKPEHAKGSIKISPLAKKIAREMGIDVSELKPGKPGKRIVKEDVLKFAGNGKKAAKSTQSVPLSISDSDVFERIPMSPIRKVIASRLSISNLEKPCSALTLTARADALIAMRDRFKRNDIKVSYNDIFVRIVGRALREHRDINAVLSGEEIVRLRHINIGVAVDSERGLVVPVIRDADEKDTRQIAEEFAGLVADIRENRIQADALTGGTFTITNLGMFEIEQFVPIINPPECCILAIGTIKKQFVPDEKGAPTLATMMQMTLVFDHRIVDGAPAARFLQTVKRYIEYPELLI